MTMVLTSMKPCTTLHARTTPKGLSLARAPVSLRFSFRVNAGPIKESEPKETSGQNGSAKDSYAQIEAPVRDSIPDRGPPVSERDWGQDQLNPQLKSDEANPDKAILGTKVGLADAFRFSGAIPEVANSRLAMLGFALAVFGEATTGRNVFQQVSHAPARIGLVFLTIFIATAVPIVRGVPRKGNAIFSSDAEIVNGRVAMLGFLGLVLVTFYQGSYLGSLYELFLA